MVKRLVDSRNRTDWQVYWSTYSYYPYVDYCPHLTLPEVILNIVLLMTWETSVDWTKQDDVSDT